jgi:Protein of unknown function (DUF1588)/Protein of unknown function (DUF1592)/Protein of unknown function (DUF1595)/Protein of unknown function (DUF1585)
MTVHPLTRFRPKRVVIQAACAIALVCCCSGTLGGVPATPSSGSPGSGPGGAGTPSNPLPATFECDADIKKGGTPRIWRLNQKQYASSVAVFLGGRSTSGIAGLQTVNIAGMPFGDDAIESDRFTTLATSYAVRDQQLPAALASAQEIAFQAVAKFAPVACPASLSVESCAALLVREKGPLLFRRPLSDQEVAQYAKLATEAAGLTTREEALQLALTGMLMAPQFLFRVEVGATASGDPSVRALTSYEIAAALSYSLLDAPPDQPLWAAAERDDLLNPAEIERQVTRLVALPGGVKPLVGFFRELFQYPLATRISKNAKGYNAKLLIEQTDLLVADVLATHARRDLLKGLLTTSTVFANAETAKTYGVGLTDKGNTKTTVSNGRTGILGQPSWLAAFSQPERTDPIKRGRFVRESLLCLEVPDIDISQVEPIRDDPKTTLRQKLAAHVSRDSCKGCHALIDPMGLSLEGFDETGMGRTEEAGRPIETSGALVGTADQDGSVTGLTELGMKLSSSKTVEQCLVRLSFEYFMGRKAVQADSCALVEAAHTFHAQGDYVAALAALFANESFRLKRP